ncbi:MAG: ABC transporter ATP-binding protein [Desulfobacteraceae bacterium]|nr:MAG: ABC transporter ATP-binding protein [Desulfobacteraceae bacterium]
MDSPLKTILQFVLQYPSATKQRILLLLVITLAATFLEGFGVAMLYPVMDFVEKGKDFASLAAGSKMWRYIDALFAALHLPKGLLSLICLIFALLLLRQTFIYLKVSYSARITQGLFHDIRSESFRRFVRADMIFYDNYGVGRLINVLTTDGIRAGSGVFTFFNFVFACLIFCVYVVFLLILSWGMTLFAMAILASVGLVLRSRIAYSEKIGKKVSARNEEISSSMVERLTGIRLLKLLATERSEIDLVSGISKKIRSDMYELSKIKAKLEFMVDPMVISAGLAILYFSVEIFQMSLAETGIFVFVLLRLMPYTKDIIHSRQELAGFIGSIVRVKEMVHAAERACLIEGGIVTDVKLDRAIRLDDVCFSYEEKGDPVLKNVTVAIPAGKITAIVGRSGAGKSTLIDLIPRLRTPISGSIFLDDRSIEDFDLKALRRSIAFVSQECFLFNDTIEKNIRYSRPGSTEEEVISAARAAYAHHFIAELPAGYKTVVGDRGLKMSGGQRQRLALARALLQSATIIILDEPTSSLDSESEKYIQAAIRDIRSQEKKTLIIIAHRLSTIKNADQIIVIDRGEIVECGNHCELLQGGKFYSEMFRLQLAAGEQKASSSV